MPYNLKIHMAQDPMYGQAVKISQCWNAMYVGFITSVLADKPARMGEDRYVQAAHDLLADQGCLKDIGTGQFHVPNPHFPPGFAEMDEMVFDEPARRSSDARV